MPNDVRVCSKCSRKQTRNGDSVQFFLDAGNLLYSEGKTKSARGKYQEAYNILNQFKDACKCCLRDIKDRIDEC